MEPSSWYAPDWVASFARSELSALQLAPASSGLSVRPVTANTASTFRKFKALRASIYPVNRPPGPKPLVSRRSSCLNVGRREELIALADIPQNWGERALG